MYIRSLPEPILIENIRSSKNHKIINTNESNAKEAIRKSDGRWSIDDKKISIEMKENLPDPAEIIPVLPTVLHKAAASMVILENYLPYYWISFSSLFKTMFCV